MEPVKISNLVVSPSDIARIQRELNGLEDFFVSAKARQSGTSIQPPKLTRLLDQMAKDNKVNLLDSGDRKRLANSVARVYEHAPTLHISFASEPSPKALERLVVWIRANIHPQALIQIGLQPTIAAGCYLRTANKGFDMSLRATLKRSEPQLLKLIAGAIDGR